MAYNATPLIRIGNFSFPDPSTYEANTATIVDSARNVKGKVVGSVIRNDVAKVSMSWRFLTVKQWANINKQFNPSAGGQFYNNVTFFNQSTGTYQTRKMYVSDRKAGAYQRSAVTGMIRGWIDCELSLVEV